MKKYIFLFFSISFISLSAQNFIVGGKFTNAFNKNLYGFGTVELLIATNNEAYSIGAFLGMASINFNYDKYKWVYGNESESKSIAGLVVYIYPLHEVDLLFVHPLYLSLTWAKMGDLGFGGSAGHVFDETGYMFPNSTNDKILSFSAGYKIKIKSIFFLLGIGYQYRSYDLMFNEYYQGNTIGFGIIVPQKEEAIQLDFGLQYVF